MTSASAFAVTTALISGVIAGEAGSFVALVGGLPAGYVRPAGAWRTSVVMATAFGIGYTARYVNWALLNAERSLPDEALALALLACAVAPGLGALLRRMSKHLERLR